MVVPVRGFVTRQVPPGIGRLSGYADLNLPFADSDRHFLRVRLIPGLTQDDTDPVELCRQDLPIFTEARRDSEFRSSQVVDGRCVE